jgi:O-antigen ligase
MRPSPTEYRLARWLSYAIGFIFVLLPFHALLSTWLGSNTGHLDLIRIWKEILIFIVMVPAFWLALKNQKSRSWFLGNKLFWLIGLYFLLHFVLGAWALKTHRVNGTAFIYALIINLRFLGFFVVCAVVALYDKWLKENWFRLVVLPSFIVTIFGLAQRFLLPYDFLKHFGYSPKTIPAYQTVDSDLNFRRIQSTLRGANPLGAYYNLLIPSYLLIRRKYTKHIALILALVVLYFTYSRSAWLGTILSLGLLAFLRLDIGRRIKEVLLAAGVLLVLVAAGLYLLKSNHTAQDAILHTSNGSKNVSSNAQRAKSIKNAATDVAHHPLGQGPGTAGPASFRNTGHSAKIAENYYLQIGQEVGIEGMLLFIAINLAVAWRLWLRRSDNLSRLLLVSLVGISFINLLSHSWADDTLSLLWWGLAGIALAPKLPAIISNKALKKNNAKKIQKAA